MNITKQGRSADHWEIISEYLKGNGLDFESRNYTKSDITDFASLVMTYLKPDVAHNIIIHILSMVHQYNTKG